jgi:hypothetical protein
MRKWSYGIVLALVLGAVAFSFKAAPFAFYSVQCASPAEEDTWQCEFTRGTVWLQRLTPYGKPGTSAAAERFLRFGLMPPVPMGNYQYAGFWFNRSLYVIDVCVPAWPLVLWLVWMNIRSWRRRDPQGFPVEKARAATSGAKDGNVA